MNSVILLIKGRYLNLYAQVITFQQMHFQHSNNHI